MHPRGSRVSVVAGAILGAVAFVLTAVLSLPFLLEDRVGLLGAVLSVLVLGVAVACTTWFPALALGVAWIGALLQMAFSLPVLPADLLIFGVLFAAAASRSRRLRWTALGSALGGGVIATCYLVLPSALRDGRDVLTPFVLVLFATTGMLMLSWTFGLLLAVFRRSQDARTEALAAQRLAIEEQERGRIARDMHDVVAHSLAVIVAQADGARYLADTDTVRAKETLGTISTVARQALGDVRVLLERLRHQQGDLPQPGADELDDLVAQVREAGLDVIFDRRAVAERLPAASDLALYRIVQESLTNVLRHGDVERPVRVAIDGGSGGVRLEVRSAMRAEAFAGAPGHGLLGMRERARLAGGEFATRVEAGEFVVAATLPTGERA